MRNHGWQPPFHPLQTVAIAVFCMLAFSFYVFFAPFLGSKQLEFVIIGCFSPLVGAVIFVYIASTWIDPADRAVHRSRENQSSKKEAATGHGRNREAEPGTAEGDQKNSSQNQTETRENGSEGTGCGPVDRCQRQHKDAPRLPSDEELLYCSICDADVSARSKHCRACDKCVHGFDHHCRWLNNCVGTRNYKPFVALMVSCLLMLILEWSVGIVVMVRCFSDKSSFDDEISDKLGQSFPRAAFIPVLIFLTLLAVLATAPLAQLFCFHLILMHKGITTYDYILAVREEKQELWEENMGTSSVTTSPATSTETGFSGYNSSASKRFMFCTPPRMFVDQDQTIMALSDLEVGSGKAGAGKIIDSAKSKQKPRVPGLNPWKLARVTTEDATRAAARARAKSSVLQPIRPPATVDPGSSMSNSNNNSNSLSNSRSSNVYSSSAGEIRLASRMRKPAGLEIRSQNKQDGVTDVGNSDSTPGLPPLVPKAHSPFRFPGVAVDSSVEGMRMSVNSDGYEASCGESGDDTSDAVGLSQSWTQPPWRKEAANDGALLSEVGEKPWVASFREAAGSSFVAAEVVDSPGVLSVSSGSRVEANILKANPELQQARIIQSSSPTVLEESPLRESSDLMSEDTTTTRNEEPQDSGTMSSFFYTGPESVSYNATLARQGVSNRMQVNRPVLP